MILGCQIFCGRVQIVLVESNLSWMGPNHFGQVEIIFLIFDMKKASIIFVYKTLWQIKLAPK